jgi:hypothetical protein
MQSLALSAHVVAPFLLNPVAMYAHIATVTCYFEVLLLTTPHSVQSLPITSNRLSCFHPFGTVTRFMANQCMGNLVEDGVFDVT